MQRTSSMQQPARLLITALLLLVGSFECFGEDTYDGTQLTIPSVSTGTAIFSNMVVTPSSIVQVGSGLPNGIRDSYNPANNELAIPAVFYNGTTYTNVVITVASLVSVGSVTSVDTYNNPELYIPSVQVLGGSVYSDVVITVGNIISTGGGMPTSVQDVYDASTNQLTIASIELGSTVYTNAVITVGTIVSVGISPLKDSILHSFVGGTGSAAGAAPVAPLIQGSDGNFYGTTYFSLYAPGYGVTYTGPGTVFKVTPAGVETLLYTFGTSGSTDGANPAAGLIQGSNGNFYGTTVVGGGSGQGTVFEITPDGVETVLYSFFGGLDGERPEGGLIQGSDGNFYGTTEGGGANDEGTVFTISPAGAEKVLYAFGTSGSTDGGSPAAGLIRASDGNFYGTTMGGGAYGYGTVFEITPDGVETVLFSFDVFDGEEPSSLIQGSDGNLYGTTYEGGAYYDPQEGINNDYGIVFKLTLAGVESVLHSFAGSGVTCGCVDGTNPNGLMQGSDGNFYGTTTLGGAYGTTILGGPSGFGTVFKITSSGVESVLYSFGATGSTDGAYPGGLIQANDGNFYGTTGSGGTYGFGTVFELKVNSGQLF